MALRVARGLFRLWLVLSVLWIGGVDVVTWWTFPVDDWVVVSEKNPPPPGSVIDPKPDPKELPSIADLNAELMRRQVDLDKERRAAIQFAVVLALVPPAFALAFGSALIWAIRGFR
jgi:hypothetical protein